MRHTRHGHKRRSTQLQNLLLILLTVALLLLGGGSSTLALNATSAASAVWRSESEVNVLLGVETNNERRYVDDLLANAVRTTDVSNGTLAWPYDIPNVSLSDQDTSVMDRLREANLEDLGLETTLQEVLDLEGQHVIETHTRLVQDTDADKTTDKGVTLEQTLGVLRVELEQFTSSTTNLRESETDAPDLALVSEAVLAGKLQVV